VREEDPATAQENEPSRRTTPHRRRAGSASEHRRKATRLRRVHPRANVRAGKGAYGGTATFLRPPWAAAAAAPPHVCGDEREREGENDLGFRGRRPAPWFCPDEIDGQPSNELDGSRRPGWFLAHAGKENPNLGLGCGLGHGSA